MKIVVIGGTGLIGSKFVKKLQEKGHDAIAAAPNTGVNTITGEGLKEALSGADLGERLEVYGALDPEIVSALGGDALPLTLHALDGGRA